MDYQSEEGEVERENVCLVGGEVDVHKQKGLGGRQFGWDMGWQVEREEAGRVGAGRVGAGRVGAGRVGRWKVGYSLDVGR